VPARNLDLETAAFSNLDDTETWRVYADWLQSVGDPRGELASLEMLRRDAFVSERANLDAQIGEREQPYRDEWQAFAQANGLTAVEPTFRRGFVHAVAGPLAQLEPVLDEMFEREPIQRLELRSVDSATLDRVCARKPAWFERLRFLRLLGRVGTKGCQALAKVSLRRLVRLNLLGAGIGKGAGKHLAKLDAPDLRALTLTGNKLEETSLGQLLELPTRSSWRELYLSGNPLGVEGLGCLAAATELDGLERLYVCDVDVEFDAYEVLLTSKALRGLKVVELSSRGSWSSKKLIDRMRKRWGAAGLRLR
jgi:uncharacterized protein (TIGR02996 family)